jgi:hypothetical protein
MSAEDEIDERTSHLELANRRRRTARARLLVYIQLFALILSVLIGRYELWGYSELLETGIIGMLFTPMAVAIFWSALLFPIAVIALLRREKPHERRSWVAAPLSILISLSQILALLPLFQ